MTHPQRDHHEEFRKAINHPSTKDRALDQRDIERESNRGLSVNATIRDLSGLTDDQVTQLGTWLRAGDPAGMAMAATLVANPYQLRDELLSLLDRLTRIPRRADEKVAARASKEVASLDRQINELTLQRQEQQAIVDREANQTQARDAEFRYLKQYLPHTDAPKFCQTELAEAGVI
jgi:hypothetical protein